MKTIVCYSQGCIYHINLYESVTPDIDEITKIKEQVWSSLDTCSHSLE